MAEVFIDPNESPRPFRETDPHILADRIERQGCSKVHTDEGRDLFEAAGLIRFLVAEVEGYRHRNGREGV